MELRLAYMLAGLALGLLLGEVARTLYRFSRPKRAKVEFVCFTEDTGTETVIRYVGEDGVKELARFPTQQEASAYMDGFFEAISL